MIMAIDLVNKDHVEADTYKALWRTMVSKWWTDLFELERELAFKKRFDLDLNTLYTVLADSELGHEKADQIERELSDITIDLELLDETDYKNLIISVGNMYIIDLD